MRDDRAARLLGQGPARRLEMPLLASVAGLAHGFTVSGSDPAAVVREAVGRDLPLRTLKQVHGAAVRRAGGSDRAATLPPPEGDALITAEAGLALGVWVADCVPILVCDPRTRALAAVHAGWRGTTARVLDAAVGALGAAFGSRPADLIVALGPAIGPCCFEVGDEVVERLLEADPGAAACVLGGRRRRIDLPSANRRQALAAGVRPERVAAAGLCTVCRADLLESYRRQRGAGGRMAGLIAWRS